MKKVSNAERMYHPFGPLYNEKSKVLILGSFPSVKSREQQFFYGHPQNRFWKVIAALFPANMAKIQEGRSGNENSQMVDIGTNENANLPVPETIEEKKSLILDSGLALWDSIGSCEIIGSSDASIRNAEPNDLRLITDNCDIRAIYCNGKKSLEVFNRYIEPVLGRTAEALPSTSPANAAWSLDRLIEAWSIILEHL